MAKDQMFFKGIPTDIDLDKLRVRFAVPAPGTIITYQEIESALGISKGSHRFKTVVCAWRRKLDREHNILMKAQVGIGLVSLDGHGRIDTASRTHVQGLKKIRKSGEIAARTGDEDLTPEEKRARDHTISVSASLILAAKTAAKTIRYEPRG